MSLDVVFDELYDCAWKAPNDTSTSGGAITAITNVMKIVLKPPGPTQGVRFTFLSNRSWGPARMADAALNKIGC